jgi:hypothetical protein
MSARKISLKTVAEPAEIPVGCVLNTTADLYNYVHKFGEQEEE